MTSCMWTNYVIIRQRFPFLWPFITVIFLILQFLYMLEHKFAVNAFSVLQINGGPKVARWHSKEPCSGPKVARWHSRG